MAETIDIELSPGSINRAIKSLIAFRKDIRKIADDVVEQTAKRAANIATAEYQGFMGDEDEIPWVDTEPYSNGHGYHVVATGKPAEMFGMPVGNTVMFAEFGAGTMTGNGNPFAQKVGAKPGSFSRTVGTGEFARDKMWHHGEDPETGEPYEYTYIPGTNAMYKASVDARDTIKKLVREKFE